MSIPCIKRLSDDVINKIAAGEIIQRPANAVKELLENCLDAGATQITISIKEGGLGLIQIQDNGCGINKDDYPILCERFTTSKLQEFHDLMNIATFGFRGEALASITHVAHVQVISKTTDSLCAYRTDYRDGKMIKPPQPCAGNQGTIIKVENLFYNVKIRRESLKSSREEFNRICYVVSSYALLNAAKCSITLRKLDENNATNPDVRVLAGTSLHDSVVELFDRDLSEKLIILSHKNSNLDYSVEGCVSKTNYQGRKFVCTIFINKRLVNCYLLKKSIEAIYSNVGNKRIMPFVYLHLEVPSRNIDVNVHPTKFEVTFLHQELIVKSISELIENNLSQQNESKQFKTQTITNNNGISSSVVTPYCLSGKANSTVGNLNKSFNKSLNNSFNNSFTNSPSYHVRVDPKLQKIDSFLNKSYESLKSVDLNATIDEDLLTSKTEEIVFKNTNDVLKKSIELQPEPSKINIEIGKPFVGITKTDSHIPQNTTVKHSAKVCPYTNPSSVVTDNTIDKISENDEDNLKETIDKLRSTIPTDNLCDLSQLVFVGMADDTRILVQRNTELLMLNIRSVNRILFQQLIIVQLGSFGVIYLGKSDEQVLLVDVIGYELNVDRNDSTVVEMADTLGKYRHLLEKYFSIRLDAAAKHLMTLPLILDKFVPDLTQLPGLVVGLCNQLLNPSQTMSDHLIAICAELAQFYSFGIGSTTDLTANIEQCEQIASEVLVPQYRNFLRLPISFETNHNTKSTDFVRLTSLPELYKVFERC